jgi:diguanylate cyclase (GGDEF)-like protein/PAS domain S-box-containing protein
MTTADVKRSIRALLPAGDPLSEVAWTRRHQALLTILWLHVPALWIIGIATGHGVLHSLMEAGIIAAIATGGTISSFDRLRRSAFTTLGLVASSAILVHFSNGLIEMHFHFFVVVALVTLYQSWLPFVLAIAFVVLHHGTVGILSPESVYNHGAAISYPWKWAAIHGLFIAGASAAGLAAWKLNEVGMGLERTARTALQDANSELAAAQSMASIGSWDWDVVTGRVWWSDELYRITGQTNPSYTPTVDGFLKLVDPSDRDRVQTIIERSNALGKGFKYQTKLRRPDASMRVIEALGRATLDEDGQTLSLSGTVQDITDRKALEEKVEHQAFHDSLTELANRALFLDRVEHALDRQNRGTASLAVMFVDLDDFKSVNDSMGHAVGDELLIEVARRVNGLLRPADTVARLGGDEFALLLEDMDEDTMYATAVAQRILGVLAAPFSIRGNELFVTASIGISLSSPELPLTSGELLSHADTAMYAAKRQGKGRSERFRAGMQEEAAERLRLRADLQRAVDNAEFVLHYQPVIALDSGDITGVEALIRWQHPERGLVGPTDFIPFAEENGLILPIGRWVLEEACRTATRWQFGSAKGPLTVAVNVSAVRFRHPGFVEELNEVLTITGLPASRLVLEITESMLVRDPELVAARLEELKRLGVGLAIDDFGTGYSSLSYLRDFPIDILKVDKAFIESVALNAEESALARAIIKLGHTLGLKVVAEGVEEGIQASALQALGCEYGQGYLFAKPLTLKNLEALFDIEQTSRSGRTKPTKMPSQPGPTA